MREVIITSVLSGFDQENRFWFKFNNLELAPGTNLKFYTSMAKRLIIKVKKFLAPIPTFVEVTGKKLVGGGGGFFGVPILNRVNIFINDLFFLVT